MIDLHSPHHKHFSVRDYACLLEKTTIAALERVTARGDTLPETGRTKPLKGFTTDNPGVWVEHSPSGLWSAKSSVSSPQSSGEERKISALGVHLRRHVTGLGVAINVSMPIAGREAINPWGRIVACGLEDRRVTNLVTELTGSNDDHHLAETLLDELHGVWAEEFERRLEIVENLEALADPSLRGLGSLALPMHDKSGISGSGDGWAEGWFDDGDVDGDLF